MIENVKMGWTKYIRILQLIWVANATNEWRKLMTDKLLLYYFESALSFCSPINGVNTYM